METAVGGVKSGFIHNPSVLAMTFANTQQSGWLWL